MSYAAPSEGPGERRGGATVAGSVARAQNMAMSRDDEMKWNERPVDLVDWDAEARMSFCRRMWRAKWNLQPRGPRWLPEIIRMTWFLQVCGFVLGLHGSIDGDLGGPFFYSRTSCCGESGTAKELPAKFDVRFPKTFTDYHLNVSFIKACDVPLLSPDDSAWSHSDFCPNFAYVRSFTQKLNAGRHAYLTMTSLFFMPIGAGLGDKIGRKPIIFFSHLLSLKSLTCNLLSSLPWFIHHDPKAYLLYASGFLSGMSSGSGPTSMVVDLIPGDMREQGFPILALFHIPGGLIAFGIGYPLLKMHLSHYTIFWSISLATDLICLAFFLILLPESMPDRMKRPIQRWDFFPGTYYLNAIMIILKYPLLVGVCPALIISSFANAGMGSVVNNQLWMGPLKFKQEQTLIPHLLSLFCGIPANMIGAAVIPRVGVWKAIFFGSIMGLIMGFAGDAWPIIIMNHYDCWGSTHCGNGDWGTDLWLAKWGGVLSKHFIMTFVGAISGPALSAMISMQVSQTEQASVQAAKNLVAALSSMYAPLYFTNHYFNTDWTGWKVISFAFFGYALNAVATIIFFLAYLMDRYLLAQSMERTVVPPDKLKDYRRGDYLRGAGDYRLEKFDYRRDFYLRAERNLRGAGGRGHQRNLGTGHAMRERAAARAERGERARPLLA